MTTAQSPEALIGTVLADRYKIVGVLGQGGWGVVYHAVHTLIEKDVAIKLLKSDFLKDEVNRKRFRQEAQAVSRLNHPNVIGVHDYGMTPEGHHYLVMDFVNGDILESILDEEGFLSLDQALPLFIQVAAGLAHAHDHGIIHRDLKPGNVMIVPSGKQMVAKLLDFGVAKVVPKAGSQVEQLTLTGEIFGTSLYLSPEQCMGKPLDARSDIYALGCVMYEILTGLPPHIGENMLATLQKHISEQAVPINVAREQLGIPPQVDAIVLKALSKDPAQRFQTAHELKEALEKVNFALEAGRTTAAMTAQEQEQAASAEVAPAEAATVDATASTVSDMHKSVAAQRQTVKSQAGSLRASTPEPQPASAPAQVSPPSSSSLRTIGMLFAGALLMGLGVWLGSTLQHPSQQTPASSTGQQGAGTDALWKKQNDAGQQAFDAGQYDEAERYFLSAVKEAEKFGERDPRLLSSLRKLSDVYYSLGKDNQAERIDERIKTLKLKR